MSVKKRLDQVLVEQRLAANLIQAQALIGSGRVLVNEQVSDKAGMQVAPTIRLRLKDGRRFVSRGGDKLMGGLQGLSIDPQGLICADIGCSTGGFTDCLLQHRAARVYAVDVGYGLLDWRLRQDPRVVVLERTNARFLGPDHIPESLDMAVIDASFISLAPLLPPLLPLFTGPVRIVALVKPQFQLPKEQVGPGGIVSDADSHQQALKMVAAFAADLGLHCAGIVASPLRGAKGNQEFFMLLTADASLNAGATK